MLKTIILDRGQEEVVNQYRRLLQNARIPFVETYQPLEHVQPVYPNRLNPLGVKYALKQSPHFRHPPATGCFVFKALTDQ